MEVLFSFLGFLIVFAVSIIPLALTVWFAIVLIQTLKERNKLQKENNVLLKQLVKDHHRNMNNSDEEIQPKEENIDLSKATDIETKSTPSPLNNTENLNK